MATESFSTLEELIAAERARRSGPVASEPASDDADESSPDDVPDESSGGGGDDDPNVPTRQALGAVKEFILKHADIHNPSPIAEARRVLELATAAGITTTIGSVDKVIRDARRDAGLTVTNRPGPGRPPGKRDTLRAFVAAHVDVTKRNHEETDRLMPLAEAAGFHPTRASLSQSISVEMRHRGVAPMHQNVDYARSVAKRKATMLKRHGTVNPRGARRARTTPARRPSRAEQVVAAESAKRHEPTPRAAAETPANIATLAARRWGGVRRDQYREAVQVAVKHNELDVLFAELGIATLQASLQQKSSE